MGPHVQPARKLRWEEKRPTFWNAPARSEARGLLVLVTRGTETIESVRRLISVSVPKREKLEKEYCQAVAYRRLVLAHFDRLVLKQMKKDGERKAPGTGGDPRNTMLPGVKELGVTKKLLTGQQPDSNPRVAKSPKSDPKRTITCKHSGFPKLLKALLG
jgi:hypothetical protein